MTPPNFALCFTCLFMVNVANATLKNSPLHFQSASVEESVTLPCVCHNDAALLFYWYKQSVGQIPKLVSECYMHNDDVTFYDEFKNPRFSLDTKKRTYQLKISDLQISDSATYFCARRAGYYLEFCDGTIVSVKGSELNVPALVHQSASQTIQAGGSVALNCTVQTGTCDGEHSVYWFRNSGEYHPRHIYTNRGRNDQCERNPDTQTHTCVYNLPMKSLNVSHAGTYYCAVASCGHILFGNGTKLDFELSTDEVDYLVYFLSAALAFAIILVVLLTFSVYKMNKRTCPCSESPAALSTTSTANTVFCQDTENLHYAALRDPKVSRSSRQRSNNSSECVYSAVKQ